MWCCKQVIASPHKRLEISTSLLTFIPQTKVESMTVLVDAQHLTKSFGSFTAVDDVSLQVKQGEVLGFLGPNGAGKSTTMRMITGYLEPSSGEVSIAGVAFDEDPIAAKHKIGYLPEGAPLYPDMTPRQFLRFIGRARGMEMAKIKEREDVVIGLLHLEPVLDQALDTLSKGFKRRVGMAQALLHDPEILILDEPTDGLDPLQKHEVRGLINSMAKDKAIIISTHILEEVDAVCTRAVVISHGKLVADGTTEEIIKAAKKKTLDEAFRALAKKEAAA